MDDQEGLPKVSSTTPLSCRHKLQVARHPFSHVFGRHVSQSNVARPVLVELVPGIEFNHGGQVFDGR